MAWCRTDDKPLSEPIWPRLLMYICVSRPQWVKDIVWYFSENLTRQALQYYIDNRFWYLPVWLNSHLLSSDSLTVVVDWRAFPVEFGDRRRGQMATHAGPQLCVGDTQPHRWGPSRGYEGMEPGPSFNIKTVFPRYGDSHVKVNMVGETVLSLTWGSLYW